MRFIVCFLLSFLLSVPVAASGADVQSDPATSPVADVQSVAYGSLSGGYYMDATTDDFSSCRIYVPAEYASDCFVLDESGNTVSTANVTVYGYSDDYAGTDDWTGLIRWNPFAYAQAQNLEYDSFGNERYVWYDVNAYLLPDGSTNVSFLQEETLRLTAFDLSIVGFGLMAFLAFILLVFRGRR